MRFGRNYKLTIEIGNNKAIEISSQSEREQLSYLTVQFDIKRDTTSSTNEGSFTIYNLNEEHRNILFQDKYNYISKETVNQTSSKQKRIIFQAGYDNLSTIFVGSILEASSIKEDTDLLTKIKAFDGGNAIRNSFSSVSFQAGTTKTELLEKLANDIKGIQKGSFGTNTGSFKRGVAMSGNTFTLINRNFNNQAFIDLEKINVLAENEVFVGSVVVIDYDTGLLRTPERTGTNVVVEILFEPRIQVGQVVEIKSVTNTKFNGQYKVVGVKHNGVISQTIDGTCKTILDLFVGTAFLNGLKTVI